MSKQNKILLIIILAVLATSGGYFGAKSLANRRTNQASSTEQGTASSVENPVENPTSETRQRQAEISTDGTDGKTPAQYEGANPNNSPDLTGYFSVSRLDGDRLTLRVNIGQYLSSGTCTLVVKDASGNLLVENSVDILPDASTSTCAGFDLTSASLVSSPVPTFADAEKPLSLTLTLSSGDKSGTISTSVE